MKIAFVHQNFPGQFGHVASALADDRANTVVAIGEKGNLGRLRHPRVREVAYDRPQGANPTTHHYLHNLEAATRRGQSVVRAALALSKKGFKPDIVYCHPGWGEGLFLRDVWPDATLLYFFEFFYRTRGFDMGFDPEFPSTFDSVFRTRIKNANLLLSMAACDWGITPTHWQFSSLPAEYQAKTSVIFDGIDTARVRPDPQARLELDGGLALTAQDEVVTFVSRNLEPYRGYHTFMRALPEILARRSHAHAVIVGADGVSYGAAAPDGQTWKQIFLDEVAGRLDMTRVHFLGKVPYATFLNVIQVSSAHVYLTYPFVLSWSMVEAMSAGALVVGSKTPPVEEMIVDGENGLLVDFFDPDGFADAVCRVLDHPDRMRDLREAARRTVVERYDLKTWCLPQILDTIRTLAGGGRPLAAAAR